MANGTSVSMIKKYLKIKKLYERFASFFLTSGIVCRIFNSETLNEPFLKLK